MARDFIKIDVNNSTAIGAGPLKGYVRTLREAYNMGVQIRGMMTHSNDGVNFTDIEALFGLPAGKGQIVFDLVNGSVGAMEGVFQVDDAKTITEKVG